MFETLTLIIESNISGSIIFGSNIALIDHVQLHYNFVGDSPPEDDQRILKRHD